MIQFIESAALYTNRAIDNNENKVVTKQLKYALRCTKAN